LRLSAVGKLPSSRRMSATFPPAESARTLLGLLQRGKLELPLVRAARTAQLLAHLFEVREREAVRTLQLLAARAGAQLLRHGRRGHGHANGAGGLGRRHAWLPER